MNVVFHYSVPCKWSRANVASFISGYEDKKSFISVLKNTRCCDPNSKGKARSRFAILDTEFERVRAHSLRNSGSSTTYSLTLFLKTIKVYRIKAAQTGFHFLNGSFWDVSHSTLKIIFSHLLSWRKQEADRRRIFASHPSMVLVFSQSTLKSQALGYT